MSDGGDLRLREALEELERYLADQVAPLFVTDSIEVLLELPPELTAEALHVWALGQYRVRGGESLADLDFHALKKIQLFEEFALLPAERFAGFLAGVAERLLQLAPEADRESLAARLAYLRQVPGIGTPAVERLHRAPVASHAPAAAPAAPAVPLSEAELKALKRFSLLLERLPGHADGVVAGDMAPQMLVLAAAGATSASELEARVARLHAAGVGPAVSRDLVRSLAAAIPDWVVRRAGGVEIVPSESVEAVRRVVKHAGDGARSLERWKELLRAAAESFNQGAFARAVTLVDLAERMVVEREVDPQIAELARGAAHEAFEPTRLLAAATDPENRQLLRRLVGFFPEWSVRELLDDLVFQPDPKKRRLLLALLEVWGADAYRQVLERLASAIAEGSRDPNAWWYHRNLVYLLHRLPRPAEVEPRQVLELAGQFSSLEHHPSFQCETITLLGQLPNGAGAPLLMQRLGEIERAVAGTAPAPYDPREIEKVLNSLAVALVRCGTPAARRALIEHALAQRSRTGEASVRLRELGSTDLAGDREALSRLLEAARFLQPKKVLGFVVSRNESTLEDIARALAGTSDPAARRLLAELAERFPDREVGRIAAGIVAGTLSPQAPAATLGETDESESFVPAPAPSEPARPRASLSGDLEVFGLPGLLQNLQQSEASGRLLLRTAAGAERARLELVEGRLSGCACGALTGESAFYQVFEQPSPGTFEFAREAAPAAAGRARGMELMGLLMEAMRRFDEFQRLRALVPDEGMLAAGGARPTSPPSEQDGELVRQLWTRVRGGVSVIALEREAPVDSYRVRSLLAHWLEEGAATLAGESASGVQDAHAG
jgi:hypothetical protein